MTHRIRQRCQPAEPQHDYKVSGRGQQATIMPSSEIMVSWLESFCLLSALIRVTLMLVNFHDYNHAPLAPNQDLTVITISSIVTNNQSRPT